MKDNFKVDKKVIIMFLISSLIITIISNLSMDWYLKLIVFPFIFILLNNLCLLKNKYINKKTFILLIPIVLVLISCFFKIDDINKVLNIVILPILYGVFFTLLVNKNYVINESFPLWLFKYFPKGLFSNIKYLKIKDRKNIKGKLGKIILGMLLSIPISSIILFLLMDADDYFRHFILKIESFMHYDFSFIKNIIIFILSFVILFSVFINILNSINSKMKEKKYADYDKTVFQTALIIINMVFVLFLISEISKLTVNFLNLPNKYTYSSYAREGFFELLFVTIINFSIILFMMYKTKALKESKTIKVLLLTLSIFSILLIFNSYYRMFLYINHYLFTTLRMQVILFLFMELVIFILLIKRLISGIKNKDFYIYFIIMVIFYILNIYICNHYVINYLNRIIG